MFITDLYSLQESDPFEIKVREEATVNLELEKAPPCNHTLVTGEVFCRNSPIRNATVMVMNNKCIPLSSTITDENGRFAFRNIIAPGQYTVISSATGYGTSDAKTVVINQHEVTKLNFSLKRSLIFINGMVYGKILEAGIEKPIEGAAVCLKSMGDKGKAVYKTMSNQNGQYLIYNVPPDRYKMAIQKQGYSMAASDILRVEPRDRIQLYFDLIRNPDQCDSTISGTVTFQEMPVSEAAVFLYCLNKQNDEIIVQIQETNEKGIFLFSNVKSGSYLVKGKLQDRVIYEKPFTIN